MKEAIQKISGVKKFAKINTKKEVAENNDYYLKGCVLVKDYICVLMSAFDELD